MPVRAVWHEPQLGALAPVEEIGAPVRPAADGDERELNRKLVASLLAEGELDAQGVGCAIKGTQGTSCHACPLSRDDDSPHGRLCRIGREQERLCTAIAARSKGPTG